MVSEQKSTNSILDQLFTLGLDFVYDKNDLKVNFREQQIEEEQEDLEEVLYEDLQRLKDIRLLLIELNKNEDVSTVLRESTVAVQKSIEGRIELLEQISETYDEDYGSVGFN